MSKASATKRRRVVLAKAQSKLGNGVVAKLPDGVLPKKFQLDTVERLEIDAMHNRRQNLNLQMEMAQRNYQAEMTNLDARQGAWAEKVSKRLGIDIASLSTQYSINTETGEGNLNEPPPPPETPPQDAAAATA